MTDGPARQDRADPAVDPGGFLAGLGRLGDGEPWPIAEAALALASLEERGAPIREALERLRALQAATAARVRPEMTPQDAAAALSQALIADGGITGDDENYDDLKNANLIRVMQRGRGLPVSLGILGMACGRAAGWTMAGLAFPGHFLVQLGCGGGRTVIDLFHGGVTLDAEALRAMLKAAQGAAAELKPRHYAAVSDREVLLRLQNNIKLRLVQKGDLSGAADVVERMLLIAPARPALHREAGLLNAHAGRLSRAIAALEAYIRLETLDGPRRDAQAMIDKLRGQLN